MHLVVATTNPGKLREISHVLAEAPVRIVGLPDLPAIPEPEETGATFAENARLKAQYYAQATGLPTVAEDSGLVIDVLGGRPGVQSARYDGDTYPEKLEHLYRELAGHPRPWIARFVCSLAFVRAARGGPGPWGPGPEAYTCEATVEGEISDTPRGEYGFGYDPIFFYPPYGCTLGEVTDDRKLAVAHRGKAFRQFAAWLTQHAFSPPTFGL